MAGVNKVILLGHVGRDPDVRQVGAKMKAGFTLATSRRWSDKEGNRQEVTTWHRIICWGRLADQVGQFVRRGRQLYVEGSLEERDYEQDGIKRHVTEINARAVEFLGNRDVGEGVADHPSLSPPAAKSARAQGSSGSTYGVYNEPGELDVPF